MATFKIVVQKHQERTDGKFPVRIRVTWKRENAYIKTEYYVSRKQLTIHTESKNNQIIEHFELKDNHILRELLNRIEAFERIMVEKLGKRINLYSAKELVTFFDTHDEYRSDGDIDFVEFSNQKIKETGNKGTAGLYQTVLNSIEHFTKRKTVKAMEITGNFLRDYEGYLKDEGLTGGINLYMRTFKAMFNAMRQEFNDDEKGDIRIPHNPFKKYEMPKAQIPEKRALDIRQIKAIRDMELTLKRDILARDVFMLSFYLVGMNTVDLYYADKIEKGRLIYNRTKTKTRREDKALISIKIEAVAMLILKKYKDKTGKRIFNFYEHYAEPRAFNKAVNIGLKNIGKHDKVKAPGLTFYAARHSWATIARNNCKISKGDVSECLNHTDPGMKSTDVYLKKDWSIIDRANRLVLDKIR
jgi:integrase